MNPMKWECRRRVILAFFTLVSNSVLIVLLIRNSHYEFELEAGGTPRDERVARLRDQPQSREPTDETPGNIYDGGIAERKGPVYPAIMTGCQGDWPLEVTTRLHERGVELLQICRDRYHRDRWSCAEGWLMHHSDPKCVQVHGRCNNNASSSVRTYDCSLIQQPGGAAVSYERRLLFIHIPKTGGTSIISSFLFQDSPWIGGHHRIIDFEENFFQDYYKFAIVRHPCSRLISLWSYYAQGLSNRGDQEWVEKYINNRSLASFSTFVEETLSPDGPVDPFTHQHLQTQVSMIFDDGGNFALDDLYPYERWNQSVDLLSRRINEDLPVFKNGSTHRLESSHGGCSELYTRDAWNRLKEIYAIDFCVLGYSTDVEESQNPPPLRFDAEELSRRFGECVNKAC